MEKQRQSKLLTIATLFALILHTIMPVSVAFANTENRTVKSANMLHQSDDIEYVAEVTDEMIIFDLSAQYESATDFNGEDFIFTIETTEEATIKQDGEVVDFSEGVSGAFKDANTHYTLEVEKDSTVSEYILLIKTADYKEESMYIESAEMVGMFGDSYTAEIDNFTIVFDISDDYETADDFFGGNFSFKIKENNGHKFINEDGSDGFTDEVGVWGAFEDADIFHPLTVEKDGKVVAEFKVLIKTASYSEDESITIKKVTPLKELKFNVGITEEELQNHLPEEMTLELSDDSTVNVPVTWDTSSFVKNEVQQFTFPGTYKLPEGIKGDQLPVEQKVTISALDIDLSDLEKKIETAEYIATTGKWTEETRAILNDEIKKAKDLLVDIDVTQELLEEQIATLQKAIDQLETNEKIDELYEFDEETGTILKYHGEPGPVIIPEKINGVEVKHIGSDSFSNWSVKSRGFEYVKMPDTIKTIGSHAFFRGGVKEIDLSNSLETIGSKAFVHNKLKELNLPESIRKINSEAFQGNGIENVYLPNNLEHIDDYAFSTNKLTEVELPKNLTYLGNGAFGSNEISEIEIPEKLNTIIGFANNNIKEIHIPDHVTYIGRAALLNNELTEVEIPDSVKVIDDYAFKGNQISKISLPEELEKIGNEAFENNRLRSLYLSESVTEIGDRAFYNNPFIKKDTIVNNYRHKIKQGRDAFGHMTPIYLKDEEERLAIVEGSVTSKSSGRVLAYSEIEDNQITIKLPSSITDNEYEDVINGNTYLSLVPSLGAKINLKGEDSAEWESGLDNPIKLNDSKTFEVKIYGLTKEFEVKMIAPDIDLSSINHTIKVAEDMVSSKLLTAESESKLKQAVQDALAELETENLTQDQVKVIEDKLKDEINDTDAFIEVNEQGYVTKYNGIDSHITLPNTWKLIPIKHIGEGVFANKNLTSIVLPSELETIGKDAFKNNHITELIIPNSVQVINDRAFENNNIEKVEFGYKNLTDFPLTNIDQSQIETIGQAAFKNNKLTSITIPYDIKLIKTEAFIDNPFREGHIKIDDYEERVTVEEKAFGNYIYLFLRTDFDSVNKSALQNALEMAKEKDAKDYREESFAKLVTAIEKGEAVYEGRSTEEEVNEATLLLHDTLNNLEPFYPNLSKEELAQIVREIEELDLSEIEPDSVKELAKVMNNAKLLLSKPRAAEEEYGKAGRDLNQVKANLKTEGRLFGTKDLSNGTVEIIDYRGHSKNLIIPSAINGKTVSQIGEKAMEDIYLETVSLPDTVEVIKFAAFRDNQLTSVKLPSQLKVLEPHAFNRNQLTHIELPDSLKVIPNSAFRQNKLETVILPKQLERLEYEAFTLNHIKEITLPETLTYIGKNMFYSSDLSELVIPESVVTIESGAFQNNELTDIVIPKNVTFVGRSAFSGNKLTSLTIAASINKIEQYTFYNNELTEVFIPESVTELDSNAFSKNYLTQEKTKIDNYTNNVTISSLAFTENGEDRKTKINPTFLKDIDKTLLSEKINEAKNVSLAGMTEKSIANLEAVIKEAEKLLAKEELTQSEIENIVKKLDEAINDLEVDKTQLKNKLEEAEAIDTTHLTQESKKALEEALAHAKEIIKNDGATVSEVNGAIKMLQEAIDNLEEKQVDKSELEALIKEAKNIDIDNKTEESVKKLEDAIKLAEEVLGNENATEEEIEASIEQIETAIQGLTDKEEDPTPELDKSQLEELIKETSALQLDDYTEETVSQLRQALNEAEAILANHDATQDEVDHAVSSLQAAINNLEKIEEPTEPTVDKSELEALIKEAKNIDIDNRTEESVKGLEDAIKLAEDVLRNENATQEDVEGAIKQIETAIQVLTDKEEDPTPELDKSQLEELIKKVSALPLGDYTEESVLQLRQALGEAKAVLANSDVTQDEVNEAFALLQTAVDQLVKAETPTEPSVDKSELEAIVNHAKEIGKENKTQETVKVLEDTIEYAEKVIANEKATQEDVDAAIEQIEAAIRGLIVKEDPTPEVDKSKLEALIKEASSLPLDEYTKETVSQLREALGKAKAALANSDATQDEVEKAVNSLKSAIDQLEKEKEPEVPKTPTEPDIPKVDQTALTKALNQAKKLNKNNYTEASLNKLNQAIKNAENVMNNDQATQTDIDQALTELEAALNDLVLKEKIKEPIKETTKNSTEKTSKRTKTSSKGNQEKQESQRNQDKRTDETTVNKSEQGKQVQPTKQEKPKVQEVTKTSLPKTATNLFNLLAIGFVIVFFGLALLRFKRKARK